MKSYHLVMLINGCTIHHGISTFLYFYLPVIALALSTLYLVYKTCMFYEKSVAFHAFIKWTSIILFVEVFLLFFIAKIINVTKIFSNIDVYIIPFGFYVFFIVTIVFPLLILYWIVFFIFRKCNI